MLRSLLLLILFSWIFSSCRDESDKPISNQETTISVKENVESLLVKYRNKDEENRVDYLLSAINISKEKQLDSLWLVAMYKYTNYLYKNRDYQLFKETSHDYFSKATQWRDSLHIAKSHYQLGSFHLKTFTYDSAFYHFNRAKEIFVVRKDSLQAGRNLLNMAIIQSYVSDYYGSEITSKEALDYLFFQDNEKYISSVYNNLGIISNELKQYDEALYWYEKCTPFFTKQNQKFILSNNIGVVHRNQGNYTEALYYFDRILNDTSIVNYPLINAMTLDNKGYVYFLKNNSKAYSLIEQAYSMRQGKNSINGTIVSELHIGEFLLNRNKKEKAFLYFKQALAKARSIGDTKNTLKALSFLSKNSNNTFYLNSYNRIKDSVIERERFLKHQFARIRLKTSEKEERNLVLERQNLTQNLSLEQQKNRSLWYGAIALFLGLIIIGGVVYFLQRKKVINQRTMIAALKARTDEKDRLALYLHEDISSDILSGLQLGNRLQNKENSNQWESVLSHFNNAYEKIRKISQQISVQHFNHVTFPQKVTLLIRQTSFNADLSIKADGLESVDWSLSPQEIKIALYGILQEGLNNIQKYANASKVRIIFEQTTKEFRMKVSDNGIGIQNDASNGIGMLHIQKRVTELNGTCTLENDIPNGSILKVFIPIYW